MPKDVSEHESQHDSNKNEGQPELLTHPSTDELLKKLDEAEHKADQYWERILRMQADNDNATRRVERDMANAHKFALEKFLTALLPIIDSLELCIVNTPSDVEPATRSILEGVNLTLKMFYTALEKFGVKQINPLAEPFDSEHQQAISMQFDATVKPGTVISVMQKGYTLNDRLLRPALVVVAKEEA